MDCFIYKGLIKMHHIIFFFRLFYFNMGLMDFFVFKLQNYEKVIYVSTRGIIFKTFNNIIYAVLCTLATLLFYTLSRIRERIDGTSDDYKNELGPYFFSAYIYFSTLNYELVCLRFDQKSWTFWEYHDSN